MKVVFSILVHEKLEVVLNQISNFVRFNPDCLIVLHLSQSFRVELGDQISKITELDHVLVNSESMNTGYADNSQFYAHFSNLLYLEKHDIRFDYVCFHASNDMFVRSGLRDHIRNFETGFGFFEARKTWYHGRQALKDYRLQKVLAKEGGGTIQGSQVEGAFMCYDIYKKFLPLIAENHLHKNTNFVEAIRAIQNFFRERNFYFPSIRGGLMYAKEEVYFPTFCYSMTTKNCSPYVYMNWEKGLRVTVEDVLKLIDTSSEEHTKVFFAVKRVERDLNDPIRRFISSL